ncbi:MAG: hypothetical protein KQI62_15045 [Deltaproteobacteria bacterium]|nr:hypothetical protein [Deltaproteobacteria bacterium]
MSTFKEKRESALKHLGKAWPWILLPLLLLTALAGWVHAMSGRPSFDQVPNGIPPAVQEAIRAVTSGLKAKIAWSSNRGGSHELYLLTLPELKLMRLTNNDRVDFYCRFSPDGRQLVFARSQKPWVSERNWKQWDVYRLDLATGAESLVAPNGDYPLWVSGDEVSFLRGNQVVIKSLQSGQEKVIFDSTGPPLKGTIGTPALSPKDRNLLAVAARGKHNGVFVVNLAQKSLVKMGPGCELAWFPDGRRLHWVEPHGRGGTRVMRSTLNPVRPRVWVDKPGPYSHEYFVRLSAGGRWMVWCAAAKGHEHDKADYEVFLWDTTRPISQAVRLSFDGRNDRWPDIYVDK